MAKIKATFKTDAEFKGVLAQQNITEEQVKAEITRSFIIKDFIDEKIIKGVKATDAAALDWYAKNRERFTTREMVRARHILIKVDPNADAKTQKAAMKKMEGIQAKLKKGAKFEDLAKEYSEDGSKDKGGDLGFFPKGPMVRPFEDAAFALKPGETSGIVKSQFGLHIIKCEERKAPGIAPFADAKKDIVQKLEGDEKQDKVKKFLAEARKKGKVVVKITI
ncbi:MAG: peptidylprolyl isomerase [Nitrospinae bacterium]|nr:peptidylprolyl isomerase [Nitrospinota bacterium]